MAQGASPSGSGIPGITPPTSIRRLRPPTSPTSPLPRGAVSRVSPSPSSSASGQGNSRDDVLRPGPSTTVLPKVRQSLGLQRPGLASRKSVTNLRAGAGASAAATPSSRCQTPDSLASSSSARSARPSGVGLSSGGGPVTPAAPRTSLAGANRFNTPVRGAATPKRVNRGDADTPPVPSLDARYASTKRNLTIDDLGAEVEVQDGNEKGYRGILRYLGEIQGKGPVAFAGIELLDEWHSMGKNDGTVAGVQYFATNPQCGMFLAPSRLAKLSNETPIDAVARPQSAMSGRQSRASEQDPFDRPPSATPAKRRTSMAPSSVSRPGSSMASQRSSSRASARPDSALSTSRPASRTAAFTPRKSVMEEAREESLAQRRAKTSAEQIAAAQQRINPGSRAAQLMNMKAKDMAARKAQAAGVSSDSVQTPARSRQSLAGSPTRAANSSPLKDALTNKGDVRASSRQSIGSNAASAKPRKSIADLRAIAGHTPFRPSRGPPSVSESESEQSSSDMPPPMSASRHQRSSSTIMAVDAGNTPRHAAHSRSASVASHRSDRDEDEDLPVSLRSQKARSLALLQAMDLDATPKKTSVDLRGPSPVSARAPSRAASVSGEAVAEGVVPLSIYEEVYNELAEKTAQLNDQTAQMTAKDAELERERKWLRDDHEAFKRMIEEERSTEREDEKRRRGGIETKEKEVRAELDEAKRDLRKAQDEASRREADKAKLTADLGEQAALVEELKKALAVRDEEKANNDRNAEFEGELKAKDAELEQLKARLDRLQAQFEAERGDLVREIDDLKDAGQETITLYELRLEEAAAEAQAQVDEAEDRIRQLVAQRDQSAGGTSAKDAAAGIDREALEEQLAHANSKLAGLEDQLAEALSAVETEREAAAKRKERAHEADTKAKAEIKKLKADLDRHAIELREARDKSEELHEALEERGRALESERAELETLRAEAHEGDVARSDAATISKLKAEVEQLTALLEGARSGKREAGRKVEELERKLADAATNTPNVMPSSPSLASPDPDNAKRFSSTSSSSRRSGSLRDSLDPSVAQSREMAGLKSIVNAMSEENADLRAQLRAASGGSAEVASLQEEVKNLRAKLAKSTSSSSPTSSPSLVKRNEELLREVSDLEALVEAGMWAKEELEAKLEDCERKLKRAKEKRAAAAAAQHSGVGRVVEEAEPQQQQQQANGHGAAKGGEEGAGGDTASSSDPAACDDCGSRDHALEDCPLLDQIF